MDPNSTGARLRAAREAAGMSLTQLSARIPYSRAALGHYETGVRTATAEVTAWYEQVCGPSMDRITAAMALGRNDVDRRSFLRKAVYSAALSATALTTEPEVLRLGAADGSRVIGTGDITALRTMIDAFQRIDEHSGGGIGRTAVGEFLATDVAALLRSRYASADVRAQAFSAAAELAYLAGFKAHDAGMDGLAQRYYLAALRLAEESGIAGHDGWVCRVLALQGTDLGQRRHSTALAEDAIRRTQGKVSAATAALFTVALARCQAESGNSTAAQAALRLTEARTSTAREQLPDWCAWWCGDGATVNNQTAKTLRALGDHKAAARHHAYATSMWDPTVHRRVYALTTADAGLAHWRAGDESSAAAAWQTAIPLLLDIDSGRTRTALARIQRHAPELIPA